MWQANCVLWRTQFKTRGHEINRVHILGPYNTSITDQKTIAIPCIPSVSAVHPQQWATLTEKQRKNRCLQQKAMQTWSWYHNHGRGNTYYQSLAHPTHLNKPRKPYCHLHTGQTGQSLSKGTNWDKSNYWKPVREHFNLRVFRNVS